MRLSYIKQCRKKESNKNDKQETIILTYNKFKTKNNIAKSRAS